MFATTRLPEQANLSQAITRMVLLIHQFDGGLPRRGSCQIGLSRVCKPQAGGSILLASSSVNSCFKEYSAFHKTQISE